MATKRLRVCVFGSSSANTDPLFLQQAGALGTELAARKHICVNGGGKTGCMGSLNDACVEGGGAVVGVIHERWVTGKDELHRGILPKDLHIVGGKSLAERKEKLLEGCHCFIATPGGVGTMDELFEVIAERQLQMNPRPIVLLNVKGYFNHVLKILEHMYATGLLYVPPSKLVHLVEDPKEAVLLSEKLVEQENIQPTQAGYLDMLKPVKIPCMVFGAGYLLGCGIQEHPRLSALYLTACCVLAFS
eukprot:m.342405 g.342405  ORF g.342405 m.342405 type:complete len:246 (+) comp21343_c0_seq1:152-889(+)